MLIEDEAHRRVFSKVDKVLTVLIKTARTKEGTPVYRELIETVNMVMERPVSEVSVRAAREKVERNSSTFESEIE